MADDTEAPSPLRPDPRGPRTLVATPVDPSAPTPDNEVEPTMGSCDPGLKQSRHLVVTAQDCADSMGSGDVPVLGTPAILALAEGACVAAIREDLPEDRTSVGQWAEIEHLEPTAVGKEVDAEATLVGHHGRRLEFQVIIRSGDEIIAKVRHRRVLVDRQRFLDKVASDAAAV